MRLALGIIRPEVVALRRMLIGASRDFPAIGRENFDRAPGQVLRALAKGSPRSRAGASCGRATSRVRPRSSRISWLVRTWTMRS